MIVCNITPRQQSQIYWQISKKVLQKVVKSEKTTRLLCHLQREILMENWLTPNHFFIKPCTKSKCG